MTVAASEAARKWGPMTRQSWRGQQTSSATRPAPSGSGDSQNTAEFTGTTASQRNGSCPQVSVIVLRDVYCSDGPHTDRSPVRAPTQRETRSHQQIASPWARAGGATSASTDHRLPLARAAGNTTVPSGAPVPIWTKDPPLTVSSPVRAQQRVTALVPTGPRDSRSGGTSHPPCSPCRCVAAVPSLRNTRPALMPPRTG
jgi:hypothetical protein